MDQAASSDQGLLRYQRERRQDPDLDRHLGLRAGRHRSQASWPGASLYQILQILSVSLFEKTSILRAFDDADSQQDLSVDANQMILFNF